MTHYDYIVAQDGSGDFLTIQEAIDAAKDGATIGIKPGLYSEHFTLEPEKDVDLEGLEE